MLMNFSYDDGSKEEQFFDYSNVTPFERFSAVISSVLKAWDKADLSSIVDRAMQVQGRSSSSSRLNNHAGCTLVMAQSPLAHKLPWRSDPYLLQLFLPVDSYDAQQSSPNGAKKLFPSALSIETPSKQLPLSSSQPLASSSLLSLPPLSPHIIDSNNMASKGVGQRRGAGADSDHSSSTGGGGGEGGEEGWDVMEVEVALEGLSEAMSEIMMEGDGEEGGEGRQHVPSTKSLSPPSSTPPPPPPTAAGISFNPSHHWWPHHSSAHPLFGSTSNKPQPGIYYPKPWWHPSFDFTRKNKIQKWFGIDHFVLILPQSYSRRFLGNDEAMSVLSAASCALNDSGLHWPLLIPIHDPIRDAYEGFVTFPPPPLLPPSSPVTRRRRAVHARLMADGIRMGSASSSHSLVGMRKGPEGQLELFASQLSGVDKEGQLACMSIANRIRRPRDTSQRRGAGGDEKKASNDGLPSVVLSARYSYRIPEPPATSHYVEAGSPGNDDEEDKGWDVGAAWRPWATYSDPVGCIELDLAWHNVNLSSISIAGEGEMQGEVKGVGMGYDGNSDDGDSDGDSGNESSIQWSEILKPSESDHWSIHVLKSPGGCWTRTAKGGILSLSSSSNENQGRARQREYVDVLDEPASTNPGNFSSFRNRNAKGESYQRQEESGVVSHQKGPRHPVGSTVTTMHHDLSSSQKLGRGERRPDSLDWSESDHSFTMMLSALACATEDAHLARTLDDLSSDLWWEEDPLASDPSVGILRSSPYKAGRVGPALGPSVVQGRRRGRPPPCPPSSALQAVLIDIFIDTSSPPPPPPLSSPPCHSSVTHHVNYKGTCPKGSLIERLGLHSLVFGNARAVSLLWLRFIRELRGGYWDPCMYLPRMEIVGGGIDPAKRRCYHHKASTMQSPSSSLASSRHAAAAATEDEVRLSYWLQEWGDEPPHPDTSSCLLHQKLQVLQACIHRRRANKALQLTLQHSEDEADQWNAAWDDQSGTPLATKGAARNEKSGKMSTRSKTGKKGGLGGKSTMKSPLAKRKLAMEESNLNPLDAVDYTHKESSPIKQDPDQLEMGEGEHGEEEEEDEEGEGDYCSASEDEDFVQGKPRGSLGPLLDDQGLPIALIQHPERSIRVPLFQFPMIWSSDRWRERSHFVHTSRDELLSYMSCFKAANPGCILDDYLRFLNEGKGEREGETEEENGGREVWYGQVWASAPPLAAWEQKKLQNPDQEGERVLHELETMNPSDLFTQLLTLSLSSSLDLLHQSACLVQRQDRAGGAEESFGKPPAIILDLITRYQAMSQSLISAGCSLVDPDRSSSSDGPTSNSSSSSHHGGDSTGGMLSRRHSLLTGHDPQVLELLIAELGPIERAIVLYQSITRRLPGCDQLCSKILRAVLEGARDDQDQDEDLDDEPAMERRRMSKVMSGRRSFASISSLESRLAIASLVSSRSHSYSDEDNEENDEEGEEEEKGKESRPSLLDEQDARLVLGSGGGRGGGHEGKDAREERYKGLFSRLFEPSWPRQPGQREWVYDVMQVEKEDLGEELAKEGDAYAYGSRMYLQHNRPGDLRLSLILCIYA